MNGAGSAQVLCLMNELQWRQSKTCSRWWHAADAGAGAATLRRHCLLWRHCRLKWIQLVECLKNGCCCCLQWSIYGMSDGVAVPTHRWLSRWQLVKELKEESRKRMLTVPVLMLLLMLLLKVKCLLQSSLPPLPSAFQRPSRFFQCSPSSPSPPPPPFSCSFVGGVPFHRQNLNCHLNLSSCQLTANEYYQRHHQHHHQHGHHHWRQAAAAAALLLLSRWEIC